jgi:hypothetical protein
MTADSMWSFISMIINNHKVEMYEIAWLQWVNCPSRNASTSEIGQMWWVWNLWVYLNKQDIRPNVSLKSNHGQFIFYWDKYFLSRFSQSYFWSLKRSFLFDWEVSLHSVLVDPLSPSSGFWIFFGEVTPKRNRFITGRVNSLLMLSGYEIYFLVWRTMICHMTKDWTQKWRNVIISQSSR